MVGACETGALAHLGLARAYAMQGDTPKAKAAYHDFLTLWKDADPAVGVRSKTHPQRHLLYRAEPFELDLLLEFRTDSNRLRLKTREN